MRREVLGYSLIVLAIVIFGIGAFIGLMTVCKPGCGEDGGQVWMTGLVPAAPFFALGIVALWAGTKKQSKTSRPGETDTSLGEREDA